ncbi:MAG: ROK family transcriptional regulator [Pyrinomonadaceae bacterium]|nr:ROK family transcriptional regulator [Pyrinomonadaceae bacterium]
MAKRINLKLVNVARSDTVRSINRQIILNYIREEGPISRADIAKMTDLQRSTVSLIVEELIDTGLINEVYGESSGGRPPQLLSLKTTHAVAIGVELGKKTTSIATADLSGRILEKEQFLTEIDIDKTLNRVIEIIKHFVQKNNGSIEGIGVSVPGMVESWDSDVLIIPHLNWHHPGIAQKIREAIGLPVKIENDANAAALAELWLGRPKVKNARDFILVYITKGIGTGIVFDGEIYRGKNGVAGEFGHMTIGDNAPIACAAGSYRCWEAFASERAAVARYNALTNKTNGTESTNFSEIISLAISGDEKAQIALKETAKYIGIGISNLIQGLSPEMTLVGGKIVQVWDLVKDEIINSAVNSICQGYPSVNIIPSTLGLSPTLKGAFSLILANKFSLVRNA